MDAIENEVRIYIDEEVLPTLRAVSENTSITTELRSDVPPLQPDENSAAEQVVRHLSRLNESGRVSYGTEAGHFQQAGMPGVIFGPGSIEQAHLPDEYISIEQMGACNDFLAKLGLWAAETTPA